MLLLCVLRCCVCVCVYVKLRAASEYEERKMIRAAIRQIRDEQQQGECSCVFMVNIRKKTLQVRRKI